MITLFASPRKKSYLTCVAIITSLQYIFINILPYNHFHFILWLFSFCNWFCTSQSRFIMCISSDIGDAASQSRFIMCISSDIGDAALHVIIIILFVLLFLKVLALHQLRCHLSSIIYSCFELHAIEQHSPPWAPASCLTPHLEPHVSLLLYVCLFMSRIVSLNPGDLGFASWGSSPKRRVTSFLPPSSTRLGFGMCNKKHPCTGVAKE